MKYKNATIAPVLLMLAVENQKLAEAARRIRKILENIIAIIK